MTAKEMMRRLAEMNVLNIVKEYEEDNAFYVEDVESYAGWATIYFDEDGNVKRIEK